MGIWSCKTDENTSRNIQKNPPLKIPLATQNSISYYLDILDSLSIDYEYSKFCLYDDKFQPCNSNPKSSKYTEGELMVLFDISIEEAYASIQKLLLIPDSFTLHSSNQKNIFKEWTISYDSNKRIKQLIFNFKPSAAGPMKSAEIKKINNNIEASYWIKYNLD